MLQHWATDDRIARLRVVDFPALSLRHLTTTPVVNLTSWDARIDAITARVSVWRHPTPLDRFAWRRAATAIDRALPAADGERVAIAATPLWAPVLGHLAARRGFDAVDDWRFLPSVARVSGHVEAGYRAVRSSTSTTSTAVSVELASRLQRDFGIEAVVVPNGVDVDAFRSPLAAPPPGLPNEPFAVYLGVVQERLDMRLVAAASSVMTTVVAGPASANDGEAIARAGATWLGPVDQTSIPALLRTAAVGLVPHRVDPLTTSMDPMKVLEYLAAGLPVVTTSVPVGASSPRVLTAADPAAFATAVRAARALGRLDGPDPVVEGRSWRAVADALFDVHIA